MLHVSDKVWNHADHLPISFTPHSLLHSHRSKLPWKYPTWSLKHPVVASVLGRLLDVMRDRLITRPEDNTAAVPNEHTRTDAIFLRHMLREIENSNDAKEQNQAHAVHIAATAHAAEASASTAASPFVANDLLKAHIDYISARCKVDKFYRDSSDGETGSSYFFWPPCIFDYRIIVLFAQMAHCLRTQMNGKGSPAVLELNLSKPLVQSSTIAFAIPLLILGTLATYQHTTASLSAPVRIYLDSKLMEFYFYCHIKTSLPDRPGQRP